MKKLRAYDILKLPTDGFLYSNNIKELTVNHLLTAEEDILCSESLITSGKVWEVLYGMLVKESDELSWDKLYFIDQFKFMLHVRITTYGFDVEYEIKNPLNNKTEKYNFDLSKIEFPKMNISNMVKDGLFKYVLPKSNKTILYKILTAEEKEKTIKFANSERNDLNLNYDPKIKHFLNESIVEIDGDRDKSNIQLLLSSGEIPISDSFNLRKNISSRLPEPDLKQEVITSAGNKFVKELNLDTTFFFPALFI